MPMYSYFHISTHHIYIHFSGSASLKWLVFSISTILLKKAAVTAQPGDASGSAVRSWALDGDRHDLVMVVPRGETGKTPDPIL